METREMTKKLVLFYVYFLTASLGIPIQAYCYRRWWLGDTTITEPCHIQSDSHNSWYLWSSASQDLNCPTQAGIYPTDNIVTGELHHILYHTGKGGGAPHNRSGLTYTGMNERISERSSTRGEPSRISGMGRESHGREKEVI